MPEPELSALLHQLENGAFEVEGYGFIKFTSGLLGEVSSFYFMQIYVFRIICESPKF